MKSVQTPWTKTSGTAKSVVATVSGPSKFKSALVVPAGTRVHFIGHWVVEDLTWLMHEEGRRACEQLGLPEREVARCGRNSIVYHDADHYGIEIEEEFVTDIRELAR